jgi:hypothetical protein
MDEQERLYKLISEPLDLDKEKWEASGHHYLFDGFRVARVDTPHQQIFNSFLTGTSTEVIYSNEAVGTARNTFSVEGIQNDVAGMGPQPVLPPYFFLPGPQSKGRAVRIVARGIYSTTSAPTFTLTARLGAAASTSASIIGGTGAVVHGSTQTNLAFEAQFDCQLTIPGGTGANSTVRGIGFYSYGLTTITGGTAQIFGGAASPGTVATVDISITNYLNINANCGTSSASNIYQLLQLIVMGLN